MKKILEMISFVPRDHGTSLIGLLTTRSQLRTASAWILKTLWRTNSDDLCTWPRECEVKPTHHQSDIPTVIYTWQSEHDWSPLNYMHGSARVCLYTCNDSRNLYRTFLRVGTYFVRTCHYKLLPSQQRSRSNSLAKMSMLDKRQGWLHKEVQW